MVAKISEPVTGDKERMILIDGNALMHRAYHAFPSSLKTQSGEQTNAVYGFTKTILEMIQKFKPKYIVCVFDAPGDTFRHKMFDGYKATRKEMDAELRVQFPRAQEVVRAFNIPMFIQEGYEADDLIGTLVVSKIPGNVEKIILTGDHDILQLVDDKKQISVYMAGSGYSEGKQYKYGGVVEKYGFDPIHIIDYKAIFGDTSDNIPGVKGIGQKGGGELIKHFKTVEAIYESIEKNDEIWQQQPFKRMYQKLVDGKASALQSKELATIVIDARDVDFKLDAAVINDYDREAVVSMFRELQFRSLLNKLPGVSQEELVKVQDKVASSSHANGQVGLFGAERVSKSQNSKNSKYEVVADVTRGLEVIEEIAKQEKLAFDSETDGLNIMTANIIGLGFSWKAGEAVFLNDEVMKDKKIKQALYQLFKSAEGKKELIAHNLKFDLHMLNNYFSDLPEYLQSGVQVGALSNTNGYFDTMIAAYLLNGGGGTSIGLKELAFSLLGIEMQTLHELSGKKDRGQVKATDLDKEVLGKYCCLDCDATLQLYELFEKQLGAKEKIRLNELFTKIEMPLVGILIKMEREGIVMDVSVLEELGKKAREMVVGLQKKIFDMSGEEFNIASPKQVGEVLFGKLGIHVESGFNVNKTKTGAFSTDERVLRNFSGQYPIVDAILEYRELAKLISTYIEGLAGEVNEKTGRVHTSYNQTIAATGRLSSTKPNLQNIPISSDIGSQIRKAFSAGKGRKLLAFDYAQQELRLLAHLSGEQHLIDAFAKGEDIHALTASKILDIPLEEVDKNQRRTGKTVNFGVVYGISGFGLSDRLKIKRKTADEFIRKFFEQYPKVKAYFDGIKKNALETGYVSTLMGRMRDASGLKNSNAQLRAAVEREIINFPLQGGAADIMKMAMIEVNQMLDSGKLAKAVNLDSKSLDLRLHLQVHDELIFSFPETLAKNDLRKIATEVQKAMSNVIELHVPILVDAEVGDNWYGLAPLFTN